MNGIMNMVVVLANENKVEILYNLLVNPINKQNFIILYKWNN